MKLILLCFFTFHYCLVYEIFTCNKVTKMCCTSSTIIVLFELMLSYWYEVKVYLFIVHRDVQLFQDHFLVDDLSLLTHSASVVVHLLSHVQLFVTPWTAARQASLSFTISWSLLKLMSIESVILFNLLKLMHIELMIPYNHLVLYLFSCLQSFQVFSSGSSLYVRWPKYWSFSFSFSPSN